MLQIYKAAQLHPALVEHPIEHPLETVLRKYYMYVALSLPENASPSFTSSMSNMLASEEPCVDFFDVQPIENPLGVWFLLYMFYCSYRSLFSGPVSFVKNLGPFCAWLCVFCPSGEKSGKLQTVATSRLRNNSEDKFRSSLSKGVEIVSCIFSCGFGCCATMSFAFNIVYASTLSPNLSPLQIPALPSTSSLSLAASSVQQDPPTPDTGPPEEGDPPNPTTLTTVAR